ncbi:MAG: HYR domain-containing protein [Thermoproteota archaeon]|nr:HYR domain-containing protein [Thermoproteota archaeon]
MHFPFLLVLIGIVIVMSYAELSYSQSSSKPATEVDTSPPLITVPNDPVLEATGPNGKVVNYKVVATDAVDGTVNVTCTPPSGFLFQIGNIKVLCEASDKKDNMASASFRVKIQDTTPPDSTIDDSRVGWFGKINPTTSITSNEINFKISGTDAVGIDHFECRMDTGKWNHLQNDGMGKNECQYLRIPAGIHVFQSRSIDKFGNFDGSPAVFTWIVLPVKEGIQNLVKMMGTVNMTDNEKSDANIPLYQALELLTKKTDSGNLHICYNTDSFLKGVSSLFLKNKLNEYQKNQLTVLSLSIKDRLGCISIGR